ncbi:uncharacterized protein LOC126683318 [Mercurialis annua]|uniref:uncharacterized protein LOC126683318 n=1 Tax=Mercurialis annua TaxID=3986 RepID=UPI00215F980B|nr:uncharacterized protein LOC126683318 [Mercurialis annua]
MVQQAGEYGISNKDSNVSGRDKQIPVVVKKTALRDVQNENRISKATDSSVVKVVGAKRPSPPPNSPMSPPHQQSPNSNAANAQLVYVRRKSEAETGKGSVCDGRSVDVEEINQPKLQLKEGKVSSFSAYAPMHVPALISASGNTSVPLSVGNHSTRFAPIQPNHNHVSAAVSLLNNLKGPKSLNWEERFHQLQILLKKLDDSEQEDYVQILRSLSSVELSRHAVELEKRSIQLSLEEAKEVQRVGVLNVLGKVMKKTKAPTTSQGEAVK